MKMIRMGIVLLIIIESYLLVVVFRWVGGLPILGWFGLTTLLGFHLLYRHYFQLEQLRNELKKANDRTDVLLEKLWCPFLRGWLLLIPGFFTDVLALLCWLPYLPKYLARLIIRHYVKIKHLQKE